MILRTLAWGIFALMLWTSLLEMPFVAALMPSVNRTLYFKLPIEGARFHWEFMNRDDLLAGELTLRIINGDRDQTLIVFRDGKISDGWEMIGKERRDRGFYFGFATDNRFRTASDDSLVITLTVAKDLPGRGPYSEGVLPAGTWQMTGTYSALYGGVWNPIHYTARGSNPPVAYMECWNDVWPITITRQEGWNGVKPANEDDVSLYRRLKPERGVNGRRCGSHI